MAYFNKDNKSRGGGGGKKFGARSFGGGDRGGRGGFGGGRDGGRPEMHKARCSGCGSDCEVPFRPSGEKPVYCSTCFKGKEGNSQDSRGSRDGGRDFKPRFNDRPSYQQSGGATEDYKAQFEQLNAKLDKVLKALALGTGEDGKDIAGSKPIKYQKAPLKKVDTEALKDIITEATNTKKSPKKASVKKTVSKKAVTKKKKK